MPKLAKAREPFKEPGYLDVKYLPQMADELPPDPCHQRAGSACASTTLPARLSAPPDEDHPRAQNGKETDRNHDFEPLRNETALPDTSAYRSKNSTALISKRYVRLYNGQLPQSVLKGRTPIDALKDWHRHKPDIFKKRPYNHGM